MPARLSHPATELVESWPSDLRVAIIGTGHLSLELGGPRQFGPHELPQVLLVVRILRLLRVFRVLKLTRFLTEARLDAMTGSFASRSIR